MPSIDWLFCITTYRSYLNTWWVHSKKQQEIEQDGTISNTIAIFGFIVYIWTARSTSYIHLCVKDAPKNLCKRSYFSLVLLAKKLKLPFCLNNFFAGLLQTYPRWENN